MTARKRSSIVGASLVLASIAGCYHGTDATHASGGAGEGGVGEAEDSGSATGDESGEPGEPGIATKGTLRRLTRVQYEHTLHDLLGDDLVLPADLREVEAHADDEGEFRSVAAARDGYERVDIEAMFGGLLATLEPVFADAERREALLGCAPTRADDACTRGWVERFGRRAFRRTLDAAELDRYVGVAVAAEAGVDADPWTSVRWATAAILQSPGVLYLPEVGEPDPEGYTRMRFTSVEMASRLAFALTNRGPDEELLDAGEAGELVEPEALRMHAERLLSDARGKDGITLGLFGEYFDLAALDGLGKDAATYPKWSPQVAAAMGEELRRVLEWGIFEEELTLSELLTNRTTFVDAQLADLYGMPIPEGEGFSRFDIPENWARIGLLGQGAFLAINGKTHRTAPTLRGRFIAQRLLCTPIEPPPPDVPAFPDEDEDADEHRTMRQLLEQHQRNPACSGCHSIMDPPGLGLEHFDGIGAHRETDEGLPLDVTGKIGDVPFDGAVELAQVLAVDPALRPCLARQIFRYASGTKEYDVELADSIAMLGDMTDGNVRELVLAIVTSDGFRYFHAQQ